jgi:hypothetical protein
MTQPILRAVVVVAALALTTVALSGCAPATSAPTPSANVAPKHTPAARVTPALYTTAPAARLNVPCSALATAAELTGYEGSVAAVPPAELAAGDLADAANQLPAPDYVRAAGGIDCIWSAGPVDHYALFTGDTPAYLEVTVQFDAAAAWAVNAADFGISGDDGGECDVDTVGGECQLDHLIGSGTWIEIDSRKAVGPDPDQIQNIMNTTVAALTAAGTPTGPTVPQTGTLKLGTQCSDFATPAAIQTALATSSPVTASTPTQSTSGYTPIWVASEDLLQDHPCVFASASGTQAQLTWIPGGAWAWAEDRAQTVIDVPLQDLHLHGLGAHDNASIRCAPGDASCIVDLTLGGNWIEATVPPASSVANKRAAATAVAQAVVTNLG